MGHSIAREGHWPWPVRRARANQQFTVPVTDEEPGLGTASTSSVSLLQDEGPSTDRAEDARQWIRVYTALVEMKQHRLDSIAQETAGADAPDGAGLARTRVRQQLSAYHGRLDFWYGRHEELQGMYLEHETRTINHRGQEARLTGREYQLLEFLMRYPGRSFTSAQLLVEAWHRADLSPEQVRLYVAQLRKKMRPTGVPCEVISQPRRGYSLMFHQPN